MLFPMDNFFAREYGRINIGELDDETPRSNWILFTSRP